MELLILNNNYEAITTLEDVESVLWTKKFNDVGDCELYLSCNKEMLEMLKMDYYIYRYDDDMMCVINDRLIETSVEQGNYLTIYGIDVASILSGRTIWHTINFTGTVGNLIKKILNDNIIDPGSDYSNRKISNLVFDDTNIDEFNDNITIQLTVENYVLDVIKELCQRYDYGFKLTFDIDTKKFIFKLYKGTDKSSMENDEYVEFSNDYGNVLSTEYEEDKTVYKTVARVGGVEAEDGTRLFVNVVRGNENIGLNRKELFVDGSSVKNVMSLEEVQQLYPGGTISGSSYVKDGNVIAKKEASGNNYKLEDDYYAPLLKELGRTALLNYNLSFSFEGEIDTIDSYEYKVDYNLGDIVKVINEYGISANAVITEILESDDENGYNVEPKFEYKGVDN